MKLDRLYAVTLVLIVPLLSTNGCDLFFGSPKSPLELSVTVEREATQAKLMLSVRNISTRPVTLEFNTSQRFDFLAYEAGTQRLYWRWSFGKAFLMVLGRETFMPGIPVVYEAEMPYEGLPPTRYEIIGTVTSQPQVFPSAPAMLDLREKPLPEEAIGVLGEIALLPPDPPADIMAIRSLHRIEYPLKEAPESWAMSTGFPVRAWLHPTLSNPNLYELVDYFWVIAPLEENRAFLQTFIRYEKSGGIAGMVEIIKIYGDGSFLIECCYGGKANSSGFMRGFRDLIGYARGQGFWDLRDSYGRPGVVADGFVESITIRLPDGHEKSVTVYQDPQVELPAAFERIVQRLKAAVGRPN